MNKVLLLVCCAAMLYSAPATACQNYGQATQNDTVRSLRSDNFAELQGRWEVVQVIVERKAENKIDTAVYHSAAKVKSFLSIPQEWMFKDAENALLRFADGREETTKYWMENAEMTIRYSGALLKYQIEVSGISLTLTIIHQYGLDLSSGLTSVVEKQIISLTKQN